MTDDAHRLTAAKGRREGRLTAEEWAALVRDGRRRSQASARRYWRQGRHDDAMDWLGHADRLPFLIRRWIADQDRAAVIKCWPSAWSLAEPDDTDPYYLYVWQSVAAGNAPIGDPLPPGDPLTVYRGQATADEAPGIAWSLTRATAEFFATYAGRGQGRPAGVIVTGLVRRAAVLGYMADRDEAEVVVDPADVEIVSIEPWTDPISRR